MAEVLGALDHHRCLIAHDVLDVDCHRPALSQCEQRLADGGGADREIALEGNVAELTTRGKDPIEIRLRHGIPVGAEPTDGLDIPCHVVHPREGSCPSRPA